MTKRNVYLLQVRLPIHQIGPHLCCLSSNDVGGHCSIYSPADIHPVFIWYENICLLKPNLTSTRTRSFIIVEECQLPPNMKDEEHVKVRAGFDVIFFVVCCCFYKDVINNLALYASKQWWRTFCQGKKYISQILLKEGRITHFKWSPGIYLWRNYKPNELICFSKLLAGHASWDQCHDLM